VAGPSQHVAAFQKVTLLEGFWEGVVGVFSELQAGHPKPGLSFWREVAECAIQVATASLLWPWWGTGAGWVLTLTKHQAWLVFWAFCLLL